VLTGPDGTLAVSGEPYTLRLLDIAQGPLYLMLAGAFSALVGSWTRHVYVALVAALVLFLPPLALLPWYAFSRTATRAATTAPCPSEDGSAPFGGPDNWHFLRLAGLAALASAGALARHDRRFRVASLALLGPARRDRRSRCRRDQSPRNGSRGMTMSPLGIAVSIPDRWTLLAVPGDPGIHEARAPGQRSQHFPRSRSPGPAAIRPAEGTAPLFTARRAALEPHRRVFAVAFHALRRRSQTGRFRLSAHPYRCEPPRLPRFLAQTRCGAL
jgi:hypothetical protein